MQLAQFPRSRNEQKLAQVLTLNSGIFLFGSTLQSLGVHLNYRSVNNFNLNRYDIEEVTGLRVISCCAFNFYLDLMTDNHQRL